MAVILSAILASLLSALALALAIHAGVTHLLRGRRQRLERNGGADLEKSPAVEVALAPALLLLVYSASGTELPAAASECAICLAEFADGDAVRAVPACGHGFHTRRIERWLAPGGRRFSCPTCCVPASTLPSPAIHRDSLNGNRRRLTTTTSGALACLKKKLEYQEFPRAALILYPSVFRSVKILGTAILRSKVCKQPSTLSNF